MAWTSLGRAIYLAYTIGMIPPPNASSNNPINRRPLGDGQKRIAFSCFSLDTAISVLGRRPYPRRSGADMIRSITVDRLTSGKHGNLTSLSIPTVKRKILSPSYPRTHTEYVYQIGPLDGYAKRMQSASRRSSGRITFTSSGILGKARLCTRQTRCERGRSIPPTQTSTLPQPAALLFRSLGILHQP